MSNFVDLFCQNEKNEKMTLQCSKDGGVFQFMTPNQANFELSHLLLLRKQKWRITTTWNFQEKREGECDVIILGYGNAVLRLSCSIILLTEQAKNCHSLEFSTKNVKKFLKVPWEPSLVECIFNGVLHLYGKSVTRKIRFN